ncbi:MAG: polysaccharide biosynthesis transport protein [Actinoplanes sp.]|nr:polysaccharide biosynthesis transport protein [Actinoplanes sp.]
MDATDSAAGSRQRVVGFADVVRIPLRRWGIVQAVTAVVLLAVVGYLLFFPATYTATTVVVLRPVVTDPFTLPNSGADRAINMTAENGIALGNEVVDATSRTLGRSAEDVADALIVEVPTGGQVLRFEYSDDTESAAIAGANAAAQTYLKVREGIYQQQRAALLLSYDNAVKQVTDQRKLAQKALPPTDTGQSPRVQAALNQVSALNDQIAQLANARAKVASADLSPGSVAAAARAPVPSSHDNAPLYVVGALLGGALLGMIAAHAREALDRRVRSIEQATDLVGQPALGVVRADRQRGGETAAAADARYVSLAVLKWISRHPDQPLVVLSGRDDEGRSAVTGNLAVALAESGHDVWLGTAPEGIEELKVILFAAQRRTPPRPRVRPAPGSAEAESRANGSTARSRASTLAGAPRVSAGGYGADPDMTVVMEAQRPAEEPVSPAPSPAPVSDEFGPLVVLIGAGSVRIGDLADQPADGVVVIDAPPSDLDERGVRTAQPGGAVLVVARDRTRNAELSRLVDRLRSAGAQIVGFVLTGGRSV